LFRNEDQPFDGTPEPGLLGLVSLSAAMSRHQARPIEDGELSA
jgi:hypothetical protein